MSRTGKSLKRRWDSNPHCFWCGTKTDYVPEQHGKRTGNEATIDHIRSRWSQERQQRFDRQWRPGIQVLSCYKCNKDRNDLEMAWLMALDPDSFRKKCNSGKTPESLIRAQASLATAVLGFVENGGELAGNERSLKIIRKFARRLRAEYDKHSRTEVAMEPDCSVRVLDKHVCVIGSELRMKIVVELDFKLEPMADLLTTKDDVGQCAVIGRKIGEAVMAYEHPQHG